MRELKEWEGKIDKNGVQLSAGDIIDLHQTVNGCNIFIVDWDGSEWTVKYGVEMIVPRFYEYDIDDLFSPCKYSGEVDFEIVGNKYKVEE